MQYQTSLTRGQPDDEAVKLLQYYEHMAIEYDPRGYCVSTSEGKDSRVVGHLMRRAGVRHYYLHNITGIDPPELIYFQRRNFRAYEDAGHLTYDVMYDKSMWTLMLERGVPPMRQMRYCCLSLKERYVPEQGRAIMAMGVRKSESAGRAKKRDELEIVANGRKGKNIIMPWDDDENRRTFEACQKFAERRVNPIAYWTTADVWAYSEDVHLEQCQLYQEGFRRLGCIGCPNASRREREMQFARWPKVREAYLRALQRMIAARTDKGLPLYPHHRSAEDWFAWWIEDRTQETADEDQIALEGW